MSSVVLEVRSEPYDGGKHLKTSDNLDQNSHNLQILWMDISNFRPLNQFLLCCIAVFIFYLLYGYLQVNLQNIPMLFILISFCLVSYPHWQFQELLFTLDGLKTCGWYLTLIQFAYYSVFGLVEMKLRDIRDRK